MMTSQEEQFGLRLSHLSRDTFVDKCNKSTLNIPDNLLERLWIPMRDMVLLPMHMLLRERFESGMFMEFMEKYVMNSHE